MKKLMVLFLVFIMIFTLAACGEKSEGGSQSQGSARLKQAMPLLAKRKKERPGFPLTMSPGLIR
jgi:uncharacterized lipoprotein YehR (DUF1307 family)